MKNYTLKLNGLVYSKRDFRNLHIANEPEYSWRNAIYHFLKSWFDDSDFISSKTSGSTGKPKDIKLFKQSMINSALMTNQFFGLTAESIALLSLPASYIAGKMMLVRAMVGGYNLLSVEPKANPFIGLSESIDFGSITPYQLFHSFDTLKEKTIKNIIVGGGHVNSKLETIAQTIPASMYETYGMTETCSHVALRCINREKKSDYFTVLKGVIISHDERGCLAIEAPHLLSEEIQTNDIVEMIDSNSFRWLGRADSAINTGGIKVHPEQIEKKLENFININFFISSLPDEVLDRKVILVLESDQFSKEKETLLKSQIESCLSKYEIPKKIFYVPHFAYSASNKILQSETLKRI